MGNSVRLGLMAPLTGLVALYGTEISRAGRIACAEINEQGGVLGRPLELIIEDDGSLPQSAVPAAERLLDRHRCVALVGNLLSNSRIAVANRVAEPRRVPYLNFSFYEGSIAGRYFFHFAALPNQQIDKMIPYMLAHSGPKMFFAGSNYEWPRGSIDAAKRALLAHGGEIVGEEYFPIGCRNFDDLFERLEHAGADVFVPYAAGEDQLNLLTQFTQRGLKQRMAVVMGHYDEAMVAALPAEVRTGFYSSNTYFMSLDTDENRRYLRRLAALPEVDGLWPDGNGVLTNFGEGTYLCVHAFAKAANLAGSLDPEALVKALEQVSVSGPQGLVTMDRDSHHAYVNTYLARCESDGTFSIVEQFGVNPPIIPSRYRDSVGPFAQSLPIAGTTAQQAAIKGGEVFEHVDIAIIVVNAAGIVAQANQAACALFGYPRAELVGLAMQLLLPPQFRAQHERYLQMFFSSEESVRQAKFRRDLTGYRKDGAFFPAEISLAKMNSDDGPMVIVTLRDISDRRRDQEALLWQATHDPLTQLPNRSLIKDRLQNALERSKRGTGLVALMFIDLDEFKLINDNYGHAAGDRLLTEISQRLLRIVRPGDTVARFGGDEFLILCDQISSAEVLPELAERVIAAVKQPIEHGGVTFYPTVSIGIAVGHGEQNDGETLLRNADAAMYHVKQSGRDNWRFFNQEIGQHTKQHLQLATGLRQAIDKGELEVYYQPIVDIAQCRMIGAEALLRWRFAGKFVPPDMFIPIAESSGSIAAIGQWVFEQACREQACWQTILGESAPSISINLSARQLVRPNLVDELSTALHASGAHASQVVLEITESTIMQDIESSQQLLAALGDAGLSLAIDDFGTGHSSLSRIHQLPVACVKIDKSFIRDIGDSGFQFELTSAIIKMSHALGLTVTAEGVETAAELQILSSLGCNHAQGYLFDRPMPAADFRQRLQTQRGDYHFRLPESND